MEICSFPAHLDYHDAAAVRRVAERLDALGIGAYSFHAPFAERIDISSLERRQREDSTRDVNTAAEAAALLGVRHFVIHPGPERSGLPHGDERLRRIEHVAHSLSEIAAHCNQLGIRCVLENKLPHLLFGNTADMLWILGAMTTTDVGVCLDTGLVRAKYGKRNHQQAPGSIDLTPGIRSLQIHFDARRVACAELLGVLTRGEAALPSLDTLELPTRIVHLPLSWDGSAARLAIGKWMAAVRPDAPW